MTLTRLFDADSRDVFGIGCTKSCNLIRWKDVRTRLGPAPVLKSPVVGLDIYNVIPTLCGPFDPSSLAMLLRLFHRKSVSLHFLMSAVRQSQLQVWVRWDSLPSCTALGGMLICRWRRPLNVFSSGILGLSSPAILGFLWTSPPRSRMNTKVLLALKAVVRLSGLWGSGLP